MIDTTAVLTAYLQSQSAITALVGTTRLWADRSVPTPMYRPELGGGLCFRARGGPAPDYHSKIMRVSYQFKCYGTTEQTANELYRTLYDVLQDASYQQMTHAEMEVSGQALRERAMEPNDWPYTLTFYLMSFRTA